MSLMQRQTLNQDSVVTHRGCAFSVLVFNCSIQGRQPNASFFLLLFLFFLFPVKSKGGILFVTVFRGTTKKKLLCQFLRSCLLVLSGYVGKRTGDVVWHSAAVYVYSWTSVQLAVSLLVALSSVQQIISLSFSSSMYIASFPRPKLFHVTSEIIGYH